MAVWFSLSLHRVCVLVVAGSYPEELQFSLKLWEGCELEEGGRVGWSGKSNVESVYILVREGLKIEGSFIPPILYFTFYHHVF